METLTLTFLFVCLGPGAKEKLLHVGWGGRFECCSAAQGRSMRSASECQCQSEVGLSQSQTKSDPLPIQGDEQCSL